MNDDKVDEREFRVLIDAEFGVNDVKAMPGK
jgi:hypothetical protein